MSDEFFRASVAALIVDGEGSLLVGERRDRAGAWQAPQGGIQSGEDPLAALWRELAEEIGLGPPQLELLTVFREWLAYELPRASRSDKTGRGQVQKWYLLLYKSKAERIPQPPAGSEFIRLRWCTPSDFVKDAWEVRRPIYWRLVTEWASYMGEGIA